MSFVPILVGAISQVINSITDRIVLPVPILPPAPVGDVLETTTDAARAGADAIERIVDAISGTHRSDENAARAGRRLLAQGTVDVAPRADSVSVVRFRAEAPAGTDWQARSRESARVAVYVDGRYHSTVTVFAERDSEYAVNLAGLPAGAHSVELRDATDAAHGVAGLRVDGLRAERIEGDAALVQRHAPIVELRDQDRGTSHSGAYTDVPLLLVPAVTRHADGSRTIAYRVAFSNEEGGTPTPKLLATYGRSGDLEPIYTVRVAADGRVLEATYQSAMHRWKPFTGAHVGERPVLRVATANNNFSTRVRAAGDGAERWSEVALDGIDGATSDFDVLLRHPWTWTIMGKELLREGKVAAADAVRGRFQVGDPRRYLYVGPVTDAVRGAIQLAGGVEVVLRDGRRVIAKLVEGFAKGPQGMGALELPAGVVGEAVLGVSLLGLRAVVLGERLAPRELAKVA
jgi:hypothetical protein